MPDPAELAIPDPHTLLARALELGAGIDTIERLVGLAREVRTIRAREAWYAAMAKFQQQCPAIKKTLSARIQTARSQYQYAYSPLDEILATVQPILGPLGLSVSWRSPRIEHDRVVVVCLVAHELGHVEDSGDIAMPVEQSNPTVGATPPQRVGIALTYARRYSLMFRLGLAPEDDDDAANMPAPSGSRRPAGSSAQTPSDREAQSSDRPAPSSAPSNPLYRPASSAPISTTTVTASTSGHAEPWDIVISDYVARFDEALTREEVSGHAKTWLKAREAIPQERWHWVQDALTRAQKRLG